MPLSTTEIQVGQTLDWSVYNKDGKVILEAGSRIHDQRQLTQLLTLGYCDADALWDSIPARPPTGDQLPQPDLGAPAAAPMPAAAVSRASDELNKETIIELDSVRWAVGEVMYLQTHDQFATRFTVKLIGFVKNRSLMVTAPVMDGKAVLIREGQTFIVRAFPGKKAYAFTASLLKYMHSPHAYLHLSYPKQVRATTIRQGARASVKIIASISVGQPEQTAAGTLNDLSMGGTSAVIKRPLGQKNDPAVIKFKVNAAGNDEYLTINAILRSVSPTDNGQEFRHGFEFLNLSAQSRLILSAFVHQTLAEAE